MDEKNRGIGRTTGLMLQAIGSASLARGKEIEFIDHEPHTYHMARQMQMRIRAVADILSLNVSVRLDGKQVFVKSLVSKKGETK